MEVPSSRQLTELLKDPKCIGDTLLEAHKGDSDAKLISASEPEPESVCTSPEEPLL
ncbi:hypothetical protein CPC08DRAFT_712416 [Agrocybe pediades]|nr:hypothetical protein CPC08DRAFT_712416 [Agrocybe pediades]